MTKMRSLLLPFAAVGLLALTFAVAPTLSVDSAWANGSHPGSSGPDNSGGGGNGGGGAPDGSGNGNPGQSGLGNS